MAGSSGMPWARAATKAGLDQPQADGALGRGRAPLPAPRLDRRGDREAAARRSRRSFAAPRRARSRGWRPEVLAGVLPRIYPQMLEEVYAPPGRGRADLHRQRGRQRAGRAAGADPRHGRRDRHRYEIGEDGLFTGELGGPFMYGEGKVEAMRRFADEHEIDLGVSYAYSDSASDLPMLRAVGNPVAVNPDEELARIARDEGWRVMRFEKLGRRLALAGVSARCSLAAGLLGRHRIRRMDGEELAFAGIARQAELIRAGEVSSRELTELYLERIERLGRRLNAVHGDPCRARAGRGRRGRTLAAAAARRPARRAGRGQGQRGRRRDGDAARDRRVRRRRGDGRPAGRAAARRRGGDRRQDDAAGARDLRLHRVETLGRDPQPVGHAAHGRRLERRQRRRGRGRAGRRRDGDRRRRLDPDPGGLLRPLRAEAAAAAGCRWPRPSTGTGCRSPAASRGPSPTRRSSST